MKHRIIETNDGIQGESDVRMYDEMQRSFRDKGWIPVRNILKAGIKTGNALEIGPGPGYLGLEWLKSTDMTMLSGLEISLKMIETATKNAKDYGFEKRSEYFRGDASSMPFNDNTFDAVFSNGSLHEWEFPEKIFDEIFRVLKSGGKYFISDLRRDSSPVIKWLLCKAARPLEIRPGLINSLKASYRKKEIIEILMKTKLKQAEVTQNAVALEIHGIKH